MWNSNPVVEVRRDGLFELTENFLFVAPWSDQVVRIEVEIPRGYCTNFASMPALARLLVSPIDPDIIRASMVHDFLTQEFGQFQMFRPEVKEYHLDTLVARHRLKWNESAFMLRAIMKYDGAPAWKRGIVYAGVRIYGWLKGRK